jgi:taurine transport system permease protein
MSVDEVAKQVKVPKLFDPSGLRARLTEDKTYLFSVATVVAVFAIWIIVTATGLANPLFLPCPVAVWTAFVKVLTVGYQGSTLTEHLAASLYRILVAFALACIIGIPLGILMGVSRNANAIFNPLIEFYRPLPPLGLYTLLVMWLGIGEESKLALLFLAALPGLIIATIQAVQNIDSIYVRVAKGLGATPRRILLEVYLPADSRRR